MRAGLLVAQKLTLLSRGCFQGPLGQALRRRARDFFHVGEIHVQPRTLFPEGVLDNNFSPLLGESRDRLQFFGRPLPCCHGLAILDVREIRQGEFPSAYPTPLASRRKGRPALLRSSFVTGYFSSMIRETARNPSILDNAAPSRPGVPDGSFSNVPSS